MLRFNNRQTKPIDTTKIFPPTSRKNTKTHTHTTTSKHRHLRYKVLAWMQPLWFGRPLIKITNRKAPNNDNIPFCLKSLAEHFVSQRYESDWSLRWIESNRITSKWLGNWRFYSWITKIIARHEAFSNGKFAFALSFTTTFLSLFHAHFNAVMFWCRWWCQWQR